MIQLKLININWYQNKDEVTDNTVVSAQNIGGCTCFCWNTIHSLCPRLKINVNWKLKTKCHDKRETNKIIIEVFTSHHCHEETRNFEEQW